MSVADLQSETAQRQRKAGSRQRKRAKLLRKLAALEAQILAASGSVGSDRGGRAGRAGGGTRPKNEMSLVDALAKALKSKTMSVREAGDAAKKAGNKTNAANFSTMVNIALIKIVKFKREERGQYTAKYLDIYPPTPRTFPSPLLCSPRMGNTGIVACLWKTAQECMFTSGLHRGFTTLGCPPR